MNTLADFLSRLESSKIYREFIAKHSDAYLSACFFVLDFATQCNVYELDFYTPGEKKIATFSIPAYNTKEVEMKLSEMLSKNTKSDEEVPAKLETVLLSLEELQELVKKAMKKHNVMRGLNKIIVIVQNNKGRVIWQLNCITEGFSIIKLKIDDKNKNVVSFEQVSLFDFVRKS